MNAPDEAYPLSWPVGWPRCRSPERAKFGAAKTEYGQTSSWQVRQRLTVAAARARLLHELERLRAAHVIISTNVKTRGDGLPYSNAAEPRDGGVAVYFRLKGEPRVLACDKWDRVADNIAALAKHIEAVRGQVRWGVGSLDQAFSGYKALPAMDARRTWWQILQVSEDAALGQIENARRDLLMRHHPDRGGNGNEAAEINAAVDEARAERAV